MLNTLKEEIKLLTGLEVYLNKPEENENCIVIRYNETESNIYKTRARVEIYIVHEEETAAESINNNIKRLLLNNGDSNKIKKILTCNAEQGGAAGFIYKDRYNALTSYIIIFKNEVI